MQCSSDCNAHSISVTRALAVRTWQAHVKVPPEIRYPFSKIDTMICSRGDTKCAFFNSILLRSISERIHSCRYSSFTKGQFAAIDAFIAGMDVPYIDNTGMMSAFPSEFNACTHDYISLISTLILLISSYDKIRNVIVFDDNVTNSTSLIQSIDAVRPDFSTGITCVVSCVKGDSNRYSINVTTSTRPMVVSGDDLISVVKQYMDADYTLTWIKSSGCIDLATALQRKPTDMWINDTGTATNSVALTGIDGTRLLPLMYTHPNMNNVASINFGASRPEITLRSEDTALRINTVVQQFLNAGTKDKKCYFCAMMCSVHDNVCLAASKVKEQYDFQPTEFVADILAG